MVRSAPAAGYDVGFKPIYRKRVWRTLLDGRHGKSSLQALILPSAEGSEIEWCETKGLRRGNLHCVDRNHAIVAHLTRRYPGINVYGVDLAKAARRIARRTTIDVANLDFTGPATNRTVATLCVLALQGLWSHRARVAITLLRGREQRDAVGVALRRWSSSKALAGAEHHALDNLSVFDRARLVVASQAVSGYLSAHAEKLAAAPYAWQLLRAETYKSAAGSQTMLWFVIELRRWSDEVREFDKCNAMAAEWESMRSVSATPEWVAEIDKGVYECRNLAYQIASDFRIDLSAPSTGSCEVEL